MTDSGLTEKQEDLLVYLVNNKIQKFKLTKAMDVFDTEKHAKSALSTLVNEDFIEKNRGIAANQWVLKGFPQQIEHRINEEILEMVR